MPIKAVSAERWSAAQQAEIAFWAEHVSAPALVASVLKAYSEAADWIQRHLDGPIPEGDAAEFGVGPLGVTCAHFLLPARAVVGVDPLPLVDPGCLQLPPALMAAVRACHTSGYRHVVASGESSGLDSQAFAFVSVNNALDHVQDPTALIAEVHRVLKPNGVAYIACDVFSEMGHLYFTQWSRRRHPDLPYVTAHPFRLRSQELMRIVTTAGVMVIATSAESLPRRLAGSVRSHQILARRI